MAGIKSVQVSKGGTTRRVKVGSKAYDKYTSSGYSPVSGSGKNLTSRDIRGVGGEFEDEVSTTAAKREAEARGELLPYQALGGAAIEEQPSQTGVDVAQPSPTSVNAQPFTQGTTDTAGNVISPETLANPYYQQGLKQRHAALLASGKQAPASGGVSAVNAGIPEVADGSAALYAGDAQSYEGLMGQLIGSYREYMSDANQRSSLVDTYHEMMEDSGIEDIDAELLDMKNVIEGSEDDIRNEVTKAGGFATESQVQALTNARNKQLIKNYNTLLETRNTKEQYLNTMIGLEAQDRQAADARFNSAFNMGMQIVNYGQQMQQNAVSQMQWLATQPGGFESIQSAASTSPYYSGLVDKLFGGAGGLEKLSAYAAEDRARKVYLENLEAQNISSQIAERNAKGAGGGGKSITSATALQLADSQAAIDMLGGLETIISKYGDVFGPISGRIRAVNPNDLEAQDVQSTINATKQIVGKYLEGGVLRKEDEEKYAKILPKLSDTAKVAQRKLENVRTLVNTKTSAQMEGLVAAGYNPGNVSNENVVVGPDGIEYEITN